MRGTRKTLARLVAIPGSLILTIAGWVGESSVNIAQAEDAEALPPLQVEIDLSKVDLEHHELEVRMSRPADKIKLKVFDDVGGLVTETEKSYRGRAANEAITVRWTQPSATRVGKIEIFAYDTSGYYKGVRIVPWSLSIPHEDVKFATDSAAITEEEEPKLEASYKLIKDALQKHKDLGPIALYIAGHTDTRGSTAHNLTLSQRRARTIAAWFRQRGLTIPVAYEGFGEHSPKVRTADEVDEPKNRRVDYLLAVNPPQIRATGMNPTWKKL